MKRIEIMKKSKNKLSDSEKRCIQNEKVQTNTQK